MAIPEPEHEESMHDSLDGIINFLDSLQDAVVDDKMAEEKEVFPHLQE